MINNAMPMIFSNNIYRQISHFGLSINANSIRAISTDKSGKITHQAEIISAESLITGDIVNNTLLVDSLKALITQAHIETPYAVICIPEKMTYSHAHNLPKLPISEISEAVSWQIPTIFPLQPEDIYYDWKLLSQSADTTNIIVTAVTKQLLDGVIAACKDAGIKPISFESSASVLARAITPLPESAIITEMDSLGSSSSLIESGIPSITATTNYSKTTDSQLMVESISTALSQLASRTTNPSFYMTGEKSSEALVKAISDQIKYPITEFAITNVPAAYQLSYLESLSTVELPESEKTINLLPEALQQTYRIEAELIHAKKVTLYGTVMSFIALMISIGAFIAVFMLNAQAASQLAKVPELPKAPAGINQQLLLQKAQKIVGFQNAKKIPTDALKESIAIMVDLPLQQFDYDAAKKEIRISLGKMSREKLFELKDKLELTGKFNQVAIPLKALGSEEATSISLTLQLKDK